MLKKTGAPTGTAVAKIYAHSGTYGTSSVPTGAALWTSEAQDVTTLSATNGRSVFFRFAPRGQPNLNDTTVYTAVIEFSGGDASNYIEVGNDGSAPGHGGNAAEYNGAWAAVARDLCFSVETCYRRAVFVTADFATAGKQHTWEIAKRINKDCGNHWQASTTYPVGQVVTPGNGRQYRATSVSGTGTTGATEPAWTKTIGATFTDNAGANQVVWTCEPLKTLSLWAWTDRWNNLYIDTQIEGFGGGTEGEQSPEVPFQVAGTFPHIGGTAYPALGNISLQANAYSNQTFEDVFEGTCGIPTSTAPGILDLEISYEGVRTIDAASTYLGTITRSFYQPYGGV